MSHISCNTGTCALPDMSALALGRCMPSGLCIHIRQCTLACVTTITCTLTLFYMTPINPLFMYILFFLHKPPILHTMLYRAGPIATHPSHQAALFTAQYYTYYPYKQHNTIHINKPILCTLHMYS